MVGRVESAIPTIAWRDIVDISVASFVFTSIRFRVFFNASIGDVSDP